MNASVERVVKEAKRLENFVWIDMELPETVDTTLRLFEKLHKKYGNVGICMQAYLRRTEHDIKYLVKLKVPIRLVKGFYKNHDYKTWQEVTANYKRLIKLVLLGSPRPCIATHDFHMIAEAKRLIKKHRIKRAELQFFNHVRDKLAVRLSKEGFKVRVYVPYGHLLSFLWHGRPTFDFWHGLERVFHFKVR
jgi:proline dehydrogenase